MRRDFGVGVLLLALQGAAAAPPVVAQEAPAFQPSTAYRYLDFALEATAREVDRDGARPTINSRQLAIAVTAMYDAWAAYDAVAVGSRLGGTLRRPPAERTDANRETAVGYALYRALLFTFPHDAAWIAEQARALGLDPRNDSQDLRTPAGVGNRVAAALVAYRRRDGANQFGDEVGSNGKPYSDWTFYTPINPPTKIFNPDCWQPIPFDDGKGGKITPGFLTAHWYRVKPFLLERADQFRPPAPPKVTDPVLKAETDEVLHYNATLTPEQKAIVEFMRDGPRSTGQSGHWLRFAQMTSVRKRHNFEQDVKLYFAVGNVAFDAFIAAWDAKRAYDSSRPWTLVRHYYKGKKVLGWAGPGKGVTEVPAEEWHPYSPSTFITPPFPGFPSGHSTVSGACAKMLEHFTGSDRFGEIENRKAGVLTEPGVECKLMQQKFGKLPADDRLTCDVALQLPTYSATAEMAGISRVMGGYHIQTDNVVGLKLGRTVADYEWPKFQAYFAGTSQVRD